jgi:hypothetical protein
MEGRGPALFQGYLKVLCPTKSINKDPGAQFAQKHIAHLIAPSLKWASSNSGLKKVETAIDKVEPDICLRKIEDFSPLN